MKKFIKEFKEFAMQGNVFDMAVGVMIGGAFGKIVSSLVSDIFMPIIGILTGGTNISGAFFALDGNAYPSIEAAAAAGVGTLNYGAFLQAIIDFVIIAFFIFLFVKLMAKAMPKKEEVPAPATKTCPYCFTEVNPKATRCPNCTSDLTGK